MLKNIVFTLSLLFCAVCYSLTASAQALSYHGARIDTTGAISPDQVMATIKQSGGSAQVKVKGEVQEVCKAKGCWMTMNLSNGEEMRILFKDYGFFVPTNAEHQIAYMEGVATIKTTSVETLRHFAMDKGMSEEEAKASITEPKTGISFEASGVVLAQQ